MGKAEKYCACIIYGSTEDLVKVALEYYNNPIERIEKMNELHRPDAFYELSTRANRRDIVAGYYILSKWLDEILRTKFGDAAIEDQEESAVYITEKVKKKNPDAIFADACLKHNISLAFGFETAPSEWIETADFAAKNGSAWACMHLNTYFKNQNPVGEEKAAEYLLIGAELDGRYAAKCQYLLALNYMPHDKEKFEYWLQRASDNDDDEAYEMLKKHFPEKIPNGSTRGYYSLVPLTDEKDDNIYIIKYR